MSPAHSSRPSINKRMEPSRVLCLPIIPKASFAAVSVHSGLEPGFALRKSPTNTLVTRGTSAGYIWKILARHASNNPLKLCSSLLPSLLKKNLLLLT